MRAMNARIILASLGMALLAHTANAATITWNTPQIITADDGTADVSTTGAYVDAIRAYANTGSFPTLTLANGVVFNATTASGSTISDAGNGIQVTGLTGNPSYNATLGNTTATGNYQALLSGASYESTGAGTIVFNNLLVNHVYQVEVWSTLASSAPNFGLTLVGTTPVSMISDHAPVTKNGSFVIGTFTADSTSFVESYSNSGFSTALLNAVQIREIPEPASVALLGVGTLVIGLRRRRNR